MKQVEFETKLRQMRDEKSASVYPIIQMQNDIKEEIADTNRQIHKLMTQLQKLKAQREGINKRRMELEKKWGEKIAAFMNEYMANVETTDDTLSSYTLVKILRRRGWKGDIFNDDPTIPEEHKQGVIAKFKGHLLDTEEE